jgi:hypothetical protein
MELRIIATGTFMRLTAHSAIIAAFLLLPSPTHAQGTRERQRGDQIVVTGERPDEARVREEKAREFVRALMPTRGRTMPRQFDDVCPFVTGLIPAQNRAVTQRIRRVAAASGVTVGGADCVPNTFLIVTRDKSAFIRAMSVRMPGSLNMGGIAIRRLANSPGPAAAWQLTGPIDRDGRPLHLENGIPVNRTTDAASRIRSASTSGFDASALVVETSALPGLTTIQLADYAAMRLLAKLDPARLPTNSPPTILKVLEAPMDSEVPVTLTQWDLGLLRGLYVSSLSLNGSGQRSEIVREIVKEVGAPQR